MADAIARGKGTAPAKSMSDRQGPPVEGVADDVGGADRSSARTFDDRPDVGVEGGAPFTAEAVGYLAVDRAGAQRSLRAVIRRGDVPIGHEDEKIVADLLDDRLQLGAGRAARDQGHEAVEPAVKVGLVGLERGVGETLASPPCGVSGSRGAAMIATEPACGAAIQSGRWKVPLCGCRIKRWRMPS